ncbi:MAG TPA: NADH-quinone oxidoreductase subunit J [Candidatus Eremiobacteraceae bacterium]|nr:NADH-quinone oxidoreductase subunit J [Candidatus Eremiobacteraceae bacterium]
MHGEITFYVLAGIAILSAAMVVTRRKAFYGALYFGLSLLASAGIFLQLYAPVVFVAQLIAVACGVLGIILFAVEVSTLNVALGGEQRWRPRAATIAVTLVLMLLIVSAAFQYRLLQPGENLTVLLPRGPVASPPRAAELMKFFLSTEVLPLTLVLFMVLAAGVGVRAIFQKRAQN